jgi:hypothetical protein
MVAQAYKNRASAASIAFHKSTMNDVFQILVEHRGSIPGLFNEYFRTIDSWLPGILSRATLLKHLEGEASTDVALLLLSMFLVVQIPSQQTAGQASTLTPIYYAAKSLLAALLGVSGSTTEVAQASVLILLYETGHGLLDQAQVSVALCTRLGTKAVSHRRHLAGRYLDDRDDNGLWQTIVMLDRYVITHSISGSFPRVFSQRSV